MEPENNGFQMDFPFPGTYFQVPCQISEVYIPFFWLMTFLIETPVGKFKYTKYTLKILTGASNLETQAGEIPTIPIGP